MSLPRDVFVKRTGSSVSYFFSSQVFEWLTDSNPKKNSPSLVETDHDSWRMNVCALQTVLTDCSVSVTVSLSAEVVRVGKRSSQLLYSDLFRLQWWKMYNKQVAVTAYVVVAKWVNIVCFLTVKWMFGKYIFRQWKVMWVLLISSV